MCGTSNFIMLYFGTIIVLFWRLGVSDFVEVFVPSILGGESISEGSVKSVKMKTGQFVSQDEVILEVETDKTILEVNAPKSGTVKEIFISEGDTVLPSQKIAIISTSDATTQQNDSSSVNDKKQTQTSAQQIDTEPKNSPAAETIMANKGIDPSSVKGTGLGNRVTKADVVSHLSHSCSSSCSELAKSRSSNMQSPESADNSLREERVKMSKIRQITASRLKSAQNTAAILTTFNEIDLHNLSQLRAKNKDAFEKKFGVRLGFMSFFIKASVSALKLVPEINAEIIENDIVYKYHYDIGVAVGSDRGLVVPVIKDADALSIFQIESTMVDFGTRAREGKLKISEMSGATFTISNGGIYGSLLSTPIINPPQSGILGMHAIKDRAVVIDGSICVRPMMYIALSYDHRIVDGKGAVTFLVHIKELLEDPSKMLLGF